MKIEWAHCDKLCDAETLHRIGTHDAEAVDAMVPVVRLEAVDQVLAEAVKFATMAGENICWNTAAYESIKEFLGSPLVAEWRARQKQEGQL